ncbi:Maf-like protein [Corynebacterium sp. 153RC1]|uniref:Maf family protein n=1 Tax=unclassified Corynebacterium TaxID=2624378 RepID=UPI00211CA829|nr:MULTISPECIES: nucleoside triphosphate pyrophosphatase [unclassified Corynebacterium]MCQ9352150.1 Maf-like protein [Corynebacterium sp. 209RC1]MCQ9354153.1 Maf-like protein [Corynebacterium sp. 1222RC1]MCQ9356433.1 Maf-like protein [Corynebacterium sp. 122RC1]MCQ9358535.1 Maf-like protein [Corynebacterium sp. 142RC1]MCQ9361047.1 Maf-like protein [Corynebacterium sp. 153RC1]
MRVVLASASTSRQSILRSAGVEPVVHPADVDEEAIAARLQGAAPEDIVAALAEAKAQAVAAHYPDDVVIGGDSMLLLDGELQGKPHTVDKAIERWHAQRGKKAVLLTGHCIVTPRGRHSETSQTTVFFAEATDADVAAYARTGEPLPCAGAFTLEAIGGWFIDRIEGDPSSVIGLSLPVVRRALYALGYQVHELWEAPAAWD